MKQYIKPEIEIIEIDTDDVITTSGGTETGRYDESEGVWDLNIQQLFMYLLRKLFIGRKDCGEICSPFCFSVLS